MSQEQKINAEDQEVQPQQIQETDELNLDELDTVSGGGLGTIIDAHSGGGHRGNF